MYAIVQCLSLHLLVCSGGAFAPSSVWSSRSLACVGFDNGSTTLESPVALDAKKKRRRRKEPVADTEAPAAPVAEVIDPSPVQEKAPEIIASETMKSVASVESLESVPDLDELAKIKDVAKFEFEQDGMIMPAAASGDSEAPPRGSAEVIPLPDIKETLRKKEEEEKARILEESLKEKRRIKRSDKEAFTRLLEQQPYADADDSFFEKEEYTTVSALLGEGSKPFLGIPTGPLQVGHFIGSLGIILMAFVDYPGFPLTNLPTPLRDFLQGGELHVFLSIAPAAPLVTLHFRRLIAAPCSPLPGLAITYTINVLLAVLSAFKAGERGQPTLLWVAKTLSVGGLAYDQLTQLPVEGAKSRR